jgi:hypothetical protein
MKLRERKYSKCKTCGQSLKIIIEEAYGCDVCKKEINLEEKSPYLDLTVFHNDGTTESYQLCSWVCCLRKLKEVKTDYFVSMPMLHFDERGPTGARAFFKAIG